MLLKLLFQDPVLFFLWVFAVIFAITVHEFSHALASHLQGDRTPHDDGRLTLNPLAHLDPIGFMLLIVAGFGWGKPVVFNPYALKNQRFGAVLVGLAGPFANLLSILIFGILLRFLTYSTGMSQDNLLFIFVVNLVQINLVLFVFNLLPVPPLDGSKVLLGLLPYRLEKYGRMLEMYGPYLLIFLVLFGGSLLSSLFGYLYSLVINLIFTV